MLKIEITIPLFYNDKKPIEQIKLDKIKRELIKEFKGLSISSQIDGYWLDDKEYHDLNKIYTIVTDKDRLELLSWLRGYKKWLEHSLEQKEIFILISEVTKINNIHL